MLHLDRETLCLGWLQTNISHLHMFNRVINILSSIHHIPSLYLSTLTLDLIQNMTILTTARHGCKIYLRTLQTWWIESLHISYLILLKAAFEDMFPLQYKLQHWNYNPLFYWCGINIFKRLSTVFDFDSTQK